MVSEGTPATFVITASSRRPRRVTVNLHAGGTATSNDIVTPPSVVTLPMNTTSVQVTVPTRVDNVVKPKKTLTLAIVGRHRLLGRLARARRRTTITNNNVPAVHITGATTISPGGSAKLTVTADQAPLHDTQVSLTLRRATRFPAPTTGRRIRC